MHRLWGVGFLAVAAGEVPSEAWPAADAAASNAAWPSQMQPERFASWPTSGTDAPQACRTVRATTLRSFTQDSPPWPGQCTGLHQVYASDKDACSLVCQNIANCSVWQFNQDPAMAGPPDHRGCWVGQGEECLSRGSGAPLQITDAERIQQGTIEMIRNDMTSAWLTGIHVAADSLTARSSFNDEELAARCQKQCYSDIYCQAWQWSPAVGCNREKRDSALPTPLTTSNYVGLNDSALFSSYRAGLPTHGEFIRHVCPAGDAVVPPPPAAPLPWTMIIGITLGVLAVLAIISLVYFQGCSKKVKTKKAKKRGLAVSESERRPLVDAASSPSFEASATPSAMSLLPMYEQPSLMPQYVTYDSQTPLYAGYTPTAPSLMFAGPLGGFAPTSPH